MALHDRNGVYGPRQRPVCPSAFAAQARRAEGIGHLRRRVADEQRALEAERKPLDEPACARLRIRRAGELGIQLGDGCVEVPVRGARGAELGAEGLEALRLAVETATVR